MGPPKRKRYIGGLTIAALVASLFCLLYGLNAFITFQMQSNDFFFKPSSYQGSESPSQNKIVIIGIDDKSLNQLGQFSSWPRSYYAQLTDILSSCGARVTIFDVLFSDPETEDQMLSTSMKAAVNVVLPLVETNEPANSTILGSSAQSQTVLQPTAQLEQSAMAIGHANVSADQDGIVRRIPMLININGGAVPALSLTAVAEYLRRPEVIQAPIEDNRLPFAGRLIPLVENKEMLINYSISSQFTELSFVDVLNGNFDPKLLEDKIVLIGTTATGLGDYFWTPMGYKLNGVEIQAHAIDTILNNSFLTPASKGMTIGFILFICLLCGLIVLRFRVSHAILAVLALCIAYLFFVFLSFDRGVVLSSFYPPMAILGTFLSVNLYKLTSEQSQKNEIVRMFGRYVSEPVADQVLRGLEVGNLDLTGSEKEVTVLFADARGFTSLSENTKPDELVNALNIYLSVIINAVLKYGGMINKFGGDSIMAVWNAPIACNDHALMALRAAVEAQRSIKDLQAEGTHILRMDFGIGINSGLAVAGNMGSIDRIEYSVIGDCVNTAAKITSLTPMGKIWIGEKTLKSAGDNIMVKSLEAFEVKGKKQSVKVYEVLDVL